MSDKVKATTAAKRVSVSTATFTRLEKKDSTFPRSIKIGRDKYFNEDELYEWLKSRALNPKDLEPKPDALHSSDKIISGARVIELTGRSKGWLWLKVIKPKKLTRVNLSPDPKPKKPFYFFIEREIYEAFGDLIEVATGQDGVA